MYANKNNLRSLLTANVSTSATSISITAWEWILRDTDTVACLEHIENEVVTKREIIKITAKSTDTFTVTRWFATCIMNDSTKAQWNTKQSFSTWDYLSLYLSKELRESITAWIPINQTAYNTMRGRITSVQNCLTANIDTWKQCVSNAYDNCYWFAWYGDWSDGDCVISEDTILDASRTYNFQNLSICQWVTVRFFGDGVPKIRVYDTLTNCWVIDTRWWYIPNNCVFNENWKFFCSLCNKTAWDICTNLCLWQGWSGWYAYYWSGWCGWNANSTWDWPWAWWLSWWRFWRGCSWCPWCPWWLWYGWWWGGGWAWDDAYQEAEDGYPWNGMNGWAGWHGWRWYNSWCSWWGGGWWGWFRTWNGWNGWSYRWSSAWSWAWWGRWGNAWVFGTWWNGWSGHHWDWWQGWNWWIWWNGWWAVSANWWKGWTWIVRWWDGWWATTRWYWWQGWDALTNYYGLLIYARCFNNNIICARWWDGWNWAKNWKCYWWWSNGWCAWNWWQVIVWYTCSDSLWDIDVSWWTGWQPSNCWGSAWADWCPWWKVVNKIF